MWTIILAVHCISSVLLDCCANVIHIILNMNFSPAFVKFVVRDEALPENAVEFSIQEWPWKFHINFTVLIH